MATLDILVGRQPIFARDRAVIGYELLFRSLPNLVPGQSDGDTLTSGVVFGTAVIGMDRLVGDKLAFLNADHGMLTGAVPLLMPPERTVVEVLETVRPVPEVLAGCRRLRERGYRLALDDFLWFDGAENLLELADVVKIDIQALPPAELPSLVDRCRPYGVRLLAEKVETQEELRRCGQLGFDLFQGYLLARPQTVPGATLDSGVLGQIRLAAALVDENEFDYHELEEIVRADPSLGVQLLQIAGVGADHGLRRPVRDLHDALVMLGWHQMQTWIAFLLLIRRGDSSEEQITFALTRARMCELLTSGAGQDVSGMAFTAGMLSALDMLFAAPLDDLLEPLPLSRDLRAAALGRGDGLGGLVRAVAGHQTGVPAPNRPAGLHEDDLDRVAGQALTWAVEAARATLSAAAVS